MNNIDVAVERPILFLILVPALILGIIPFLRIQKKRRVSTKHLIPFIIHLSLIFLLSGLLGGVTVTRVSDEATKTKIVFLADVSDSNIYTKSQMNDFIKKIVDEADEERTSFAVVMFANDVVKVVDSDEFDDIKRDYLDFESKNTKTDQTNIDAAIERASTLFEKANVKNKKIIVLSDGLETLGDGLSAAHRLEEDVQLSGAHFSAVAEGTENKEVQFVSINTASRVPEGGQVTVELVIKSTRLVHRAEIKIQDGDITTSRVEKLQPGTNVFKITYTPEVAGVNTIRATVDVDASDDVYEENNILYTWYLLDAQKTVLVVDGDARNNSQPSQFDQIKNSQVLENLKDYAIRGPIAPSRFPSTLEELLEYDQVVLMDVNFSDLPENAGENLKRYVKEVGRGLFVSFGDNFYEIGKDGYKYKESPIAEILPVDLKLEEERETVAMVMVVDLSSSMKEAMGNKSRFYVVLESVLKVLMLGATEEEKEKGEGFDDSDYVGIVCFDQDSHIALEMQRLGDKANREIICKKVERELRHYYFYHYFDKEGRETDITIKDSDGDTYTSQGYKYPPDYSSQPGADKVTGERIKTFGTSYKWAIQAASDMLAKKNNETTLHIKQVLLMSDGEPNDKGSGYEGIVERMTTAGTVTSSISIGEVKDDSDQIKELTKIAEAGRGTIVKVSTADDLTNEIVQKAEEIKTELVNEQDVQPMRLSYSSSILQGVRDYEIIGGYYGSSIKDDANLILYVDKLRPLYAEWDCGLGKVGVYMSDLGNSAWTDVLFQDSNGINLVSNMFTATMNRQVDSTGLEYSAVRNEETTAINVTLPAELRAGEKLVAQLVDINGNSISKFYEFTGANKKYNAIIPTSELEKTYIIQLSLRDEKTKYNDITTFAVTGYYNYEYDMFNDAGVDNLSIISNNANGKLLTSTDGLFDDVKNEVTVSDYNISTPAAIAALVLFILDILFRNIVVVRKKEKVQMTDEEQLASMRGR